MKTGTVGIAIATGMTTITTANTAELSSSPSRTETIFSGNADFSWAIQRVLTCGLGVQNAATEYKLGAERTLREIQTKAALRRCRSI